MSQPGLADPTAGPACVPNARETLGALGTNTRSHLRAPRRRLQRREEVARVDELLDELLADLEPESKPVVDLDGLARNDAREGDVSRRPERLDAQGLERTDESVGRESGAPYSEGVCGKSRCVTYSSTIAPVAAAALGLARTAVIAPSEKPEIHASA